MAHRRNGHAVEVEVGSEGRHGAAGAGILRRVLLRGSRSLAWLRVHGVGRVPGCVRGCEGQLVF